MTVAERKPERKVEKFPFQPLLVLGGWFYIISHSLGLESPAQIASTGPGMEVIASMIATSSGFPVAFASKSGMCLAPPGPWDFVDFLRAFAMWSAMVLAMMLPTFWYRVSGVLRPRP